MTVEVKERTTTYLTATFKDKAGAAQAPATAKYRIDCLTTGVAIRAETALAPAGAVEITLTKDDTRIVNAQNVREIRRVTVMASYSATDEVNEEYDFDVLNLKYL